MEWTDNSEILKKWTVKQEGHLKKYRIWSTMYRAWIRYEKLQTPTREPKTLEAPHRLFLTKRLFWNFLWKRFKI